MIEGIHHGGGLRRGKAETTHRAKAPDRVGGPYRPLEPPWQARRNVRDPHPMHPLPHRTPARILGWTAALAGLWMTPLMAAEIKADWNAWANFARYADENARTPPPKPGEARVVFLGDSILEGWPRLRPDFFANKPWHCRAISGQTTPQMLLRFQADVAALKPTIVVFKGGINDIACNSGPYDPSRTLDNIKSIARLAKAQGMTIILCSVLPAHDFRWRPGLEPAPKVVALNRAIHDFANAEGFLWLDLHTPLADGRQGLRPKHATDGVHPTAAGYQVIEPLVEKAIADAIAGRRGKHP